MPKIRALHPEFWTDDSVVSVQPLARLLFQGLWNYACDNGHVEDKPRQLKMRILPADHCDVSELLGELAAQEMIVREDGWVVVPNLSKRQKPDKRYFLCCDFPGCKDGKPALGTRRVAPPEPDEIPPDPQGAHDVDPKGPHRAPVVARRSPSTDGDGDGDGDGDKKRVPHKLGHRLPENWLPSAETRALIASERPDLDLRAEHQDFCDYWHAEAGQKARKVNWDLAWRRWMRGQGKRNGQQRTQPVPAYQPLPLPPEEELDWDAAS